MALVRFPEGQQRSGSVGGATFSHNRYGAYIRARSIPVNPNTQRQVSVRLAMQALAIRWGTVLTQNQRDAWDLYASNITWQSALSEAVFLTGLNHYIRSNVPRIMCSLAIIDDGPCIMYLADPEMTLGATASEAAGQLTITFDDTAPWCSITGAFQIVYMGKPVAAARKFFNTPYRRAQCLFGEDPVAAIVQDSNDNANSKAKKTNAKSANPKALGGPGVLAPPSSPDIVASPWPLCEGCRIWIRSRVGLADGRLSDFADFNFLCDA